MKNKKQFLICMMLIVTMLFGSVQVFAKEDVNKFILANKMLKGIEKTFKSDELEMISEQTFKIDLSEMGMNNEVMNDESLKKVFELYSNFKIRSKIQKINKNYEVKINIEVLCKDELVTDGNIYINDKYIAIDIPMLYSKPFYLKWDEIDKFIEMCEVEYGLEIPQISYKEYLKWFDVEKSEEYKKIDLNKYVEMYKGYLESNLKKGKTISVSIPVDGKTKIVGCKEIVLEQNMEDYFELIMEFVQKLCMDEKVQDFVIVKANELIDILIETEDYKMVNISLEELNEAKKYINENRKEIFEAINESVKQEMYQYTNAIDEYEKEIKEETEIREIKEITEIKEGIELNPKYIIKYRFNYQGYLINVLQENSIQGVLAKQNIIFTKFSNVEIEKININDGVNIAEITQQKAEQLSVEISNHVQKEIEKNKVIQEIIKDMENELTY